MAAARDTDMIPAVGTSAPQETAARAFPARAKVATGAGAVSLTVHDKIETAAPAWRALMSAQAVMTPYQRIAFVRAWHRLLGEKEGTFLRIVEGRGPDGAVWFVWPLGLSRTFGLPVLHWLGGKHANYFFGLYAPQALAALNGADWRNMLHAATRAASADAAMLVNQPENWGGIANPLSAARTAASPSPCHAIALQADAEALISRLRNRGSRKKLRRNIRRLEETAGPVELVHASSPEEIDAVLAALSAHKSQLGGARADKQIFCDEAVTSFLATAARAQEDGTPEGIEIYALKAGERIVATFGCAVDSVRVAGTFISIDAQDFAACAPGEVLISKLLEHFCGRGLQRFDLGVGEAEYKRRWCHDTEPLFDTLLPASLRGRLVGVPLLRLAMAAKAALKRSPALLEKLQRLRAALS